MLGDTRGAFSILVKICQRPVLLSFCIFLIVTYGCKETKESECDGGECQTSENDISIESDDTDEEADLNFDDNSDKNNGKKSSADSDTDVDNDSDDESDESNTDADSDSENDETGSDSDSDSDSDTDNESSSDSDSDSDTDNDNDESSNLETETPDDSDPDTENDDESGAESDNTCQHDCVNRCDLIGGNVMPGICADENQQCCDTFPDTDSDSGNTDEEDTEDNGDTEIKTDTDENTGSAITFFDDLPDGTQPEEVGRKVAERFSQDQSNAEGHYAEAATWYGALSVAGFLGDQDLINSLISKFDSTYKDNFYNHFSERNHVDDNIWGIVPFEIALQTSDNSYVELGVGLADHQIANKDNPNQIRYAIDDMFMLIGLQVQAYRATGAPQYLDFAATTMVSYLDRLQKDDGCFFHLSNNDIKWGRGNGWFAAGMAEILRELDSSHQHYNAIMAGYEKMMAGLLDYQIKDGDGAGLWKQVLDVNNPSNTAETSGSTMFATAMITGVKNGWLAEATYGEAARNAWIALVSYIDDEGRLKEVSAWCYFYQPDGGVSVLDQYINRYRNVGDYHGQAPILWAAAALLR